MNQKFYSLLGLVFFFVIFLFFQSDLDRATKINLDLQNLAPSWHHLFGCDDLGRDLLQRCLFAVKISLIVGVISTIIDMILGSIFGMAAALLPTSLSLVMTRFLDVMTILPQMLLSILIVMFVGNGLVSLIIAISLTGWLPTARAIRLEMMRLKKMDFMKSLKGFGLPTFHIIMKHLLPACIPTLFVSSALCLPQAIFSEAFMSFLGLGVNPPTPSLGNMITDGLGAIQYYPWRFFFPAGIIFTVIFSMNSLIDILKRKWGFVT